MLSSLKPNTSGCLARLHGRAGASFDVAVIIPTRDRPEDLEITVSSLLAQTVLPKEIIIVDQSTTDEGMRRVTSTLALTRSVVQVRWIQDTTISGASAARNRAIPLVGTPITLFLDDDVILEPSFVQAIQDTYRRYEVHGVSGVITNYYPPSRAVRLWTSVFVHRPFYDDRQPIYWSASTHISEVLRVTRFGAGLMSFWTKAIASHRFDEHLTGACAGEDVDFCVRLGTNAVLVITKEARLIHKQSPVARSPERWLLREVRTAWYLFRRNWNHGFGNRLSLMWLSIGYMTVAIFISFRRLSIRPVKDVLCAIRDSAFLVTTGT